MKYKLAIVAKLSECFHYSYNTLLRVLQIWSATNHQMTKVFFGNLSVSL